MKIAFFDLEGWEEEILRAEFEGHELMLFNDSLQNHLDELADAEAISVFIHSPVRKEEMERMPKLRIIATRSTGFDHIDLEEAKKRGIVVFNVPAYGQNTVAEFTFALILALTRKLLEAARRVKEGKFTTEGLRGMDLMGKTLGVVGTGRIGRHVIRIAKGFGMNVIAYDAYPNESLSEELGFEYVSFEELLEKSDIITFHVPYLPSTHHMLNQENIGKLKKGVIIINTARGPVIDTEALVKGLKEGIIGGLGLDVLEGERLMNVDDAAGLTEEQLRILEENHILLKHDNVIITPHTAFNTHEAVRRILDTTIQNLKEMPEGNRVA